MLLLFQASPACKQDLPREFDWLSICRNLGIFLDEWLCIQGIHAVQAIEGLTVEISLIRVWVISWNLPDGSAEMNQAIEMSRGGGAR